MAVPNGKVMMLEMLQRRHLKGSGAGSSSVLFFDDDAANLHNCHRANFFRLISHTPDDGFTQSMLASLAGKKLRKERVSVTSC